MNHMEFKQCELLSVRKKVSGAGFLVRVRQFQNDVLNITLSPASSRPRAKSSQGLGFSFANNLIRGDLWTTTH